MGARATLLLVALGSVAAHAHTVPVAPATCVLDPLEIVQPATGIAAVVAPPTAADAQRLVFGVGSGTVQVCAADPAQPLERCLGQAVPRAFTVGAGGGTLALPASFRAAVSASGDVVATGVSLAVTIDGVAAVAPVALTTGLAVAGDVVAEGAPFDAGGAFTLVGVVGADVWPAPLDASPVVVRARCGAAPAPDLDQFALPATLMKLAGTIGGGHLRVQARLRVHDETVGDPTAVPALARVTVAGAVATGVPAVRRKGKRTSPATYRVTLDVPFALPAVAGRAAAVGLTLDAGAVLVRTATPFRARRRGTRLVRR